jgi:hypothetical protein
MDKRKEIAAICGLTSVSNKSAKLAQYTRRRRPVALEAGFVGVPEERCASCSPTCRGARSGRSPATPACAS